MFIPKSKMSLIGAVLEAAIDSPLGHGLDEDEHELINQIRDKVALCQNGDANWLEVEVCYANKPK
jgi:hypothetical protein